MNHFPNTSPPPYILVELHEIGVDTDEQPEHWPGPQEWPYCPRVGEFIELAGGVDLPLRRVRYRVVEVLWVVHVADVSKRRTVMVNLEKSNG